MTTPAKIAANRQNALKSTGPRTPEGKTLVGQNAMRQSVFASGSILPGLESRARWQAHLAGTIANLAPIGQVEVALAERVALILWRLARISTFEQDVTHHARVRSYDETLVKRRPILAIDGIETIDEILQRLTRARAQLHALQRFATRPPDTLLAGRHAKLVLTAIARQIDGFDLNRFSAPDLVPDGIPWANIPNWTVERLRRLVETIARQTERDPEQLIAAATVAARDALNRARSAQRTFERQVRDLRAERTLPEPAPLDRILRYETHLTRQLDQTLKQLRTLQHARHATLRPCGERLPAETNPPSGPAPSSRLTPHPAALVALLHDLPSKSTDGPQSASPAHTEI